MIPNEVFHYTKRDTALEHILLDKKIRLGQIGLTNDPRESKEWWFPLQSNKALKPKVFLDLEQKVINSANNIGTKEWKVLCVSQHHPDHLSRQHNPFVQGFCRPRMWAHYSDNHKGVCFRFNGLKIDEQIQKELGNKCKVFRGPIVYDDINSIAPYPINIDKIIAKGLEEGIREYFFEYYEHFFLTKSKDWETEYEYRWIIHGTSMSPEYISIENCIVGVIVGVDFPEVYEPSLIKLCKDLNIPVGRMVWRNGTPNVNLESIYKP
jgi:hypothetical protein